MIRSMNQLTHLQKLEAESIHILREVVATSKNPVMLYSIGKDSAVMLHLARKAFFPGTLPFPLLHVDTRWKFSQMIKFRDQIVKDYNLDLLVYINPEGTEKNINPITHGGAFGSQVTVDGLGLILGHGVSRFDPRPRQPNSPGHGKKTLHNMCPTIVTKDGNPWLAVGGRGARRIPNSVFDILVGILAGKSPQQAIAAPRMHTTGNLNLVLEAEWQASDVENLKRIGYEVTTGLMARANMAYKDPVTGKLSTETR
jgi:hypothetical protein